MSKLLQLTLSFALGVFTMYVVVMGVEIMDMSESKEIGNKGESWNEIKYSKPFTNVIVNSTEKIREECIKNGGKLIHNTYAPQIIDGCQYNIAEEDKIEWNNLECDRWYSSTSSTCPISLTDEGKFDSKTHDKCMQNIDKCWSIGQKTRIYFK